MTVIVPAYRAERTLRRCVESLLAQDSPVPFEVIVVLSDDAACPTIGLPDDDRLQLITHVPRLTAARARNRAAAVARGDALVFIDADAIAEPGWLSSLVVESLDLTRCVAGAIRNGTPRSAIGTAEYLVAFADLSPGRPNRVCWHGATCNLLVPPRLWERYGPFPEDMRGGEDTLLTSAAYADGLLRFASGAVVVHMNRTRLGEVAAHQYEYGRFTADLVRRSRHYKRRRFLRHTALAPLAGVGRLVSAYARTARWLARPRSAVFRAAPVVALCLAAWSAGLAVEGVRLDRAARAASRSGVGSR